MPESPASSSHSSESLSDVLSQMAEPEPAEPSLSAEAEPPPLHDAQPARGEQDEQNDGAPTSDGVQDSDHDALAAAAAAAQAPAESQADPDATLIIRDQDALAAGDGQQPPEVAADSDEDATSDAAADDAEEAVVDSDAVASDPPVADQSEATEAPPANDDGEPGDVAARADDSDDSVDASIATEDDPSAEQPAGVDDPSQVIATDDDANNIDTGAEHGVESDMVDSVDTIDMAAALAGEVAAASPGTRKPVRPPRRGKNADLKAFAIPVCLTLGLLLLLPATWAVLHLIGVKNAGEPDGITPDEADQGGTMLAYAMLTAWPVSLALIFIAVLFMIHAARDRKEAKRLEQAERK